MPDSPALPSWCWRPLAANWEMSLITAAERQYAVARQARIEARLL
ncbi:hypothetical protein [Enterovirga aerilata]|nr:hypothetical protein [Enterovirga sp. DB1703]